MPDQEPNWRELRVRIEALLKRHEHELPADTAVAVRHYIDHDEYEIAFEGLCLDLMAHRVSGVDWTLCRALALTLGLNEESVLDGDFWAKLGERFLDSR